MSVMIDASNYAYDAITINGRNVSISNILQNDVTPQSEFEQNTFSFIRDWLNNNELFSVHTSGSTGVPKKIELRRDQMAQSARMTIQALGLAKNDAALVCLNTQYIGGKMMLVRALVGQMRIIAVEPSSNPLQSIVQPFNFTALVPLQLQTILHSENKKQLDYIKAILVGGAAVNQTQLEALQQIKSPVYSTYGMTETISHIALQTLNGTSADTSFKTLPGIKIHKDARNCLVIQAPYLQEEIVTNDLVDIQDDHSFTWVGRWDNVINTGGVKVSPEKVENEILRLMSSLKFQQNFFITGMPDEVLGEKVILIVEGNLNENWGKILTLLKQSFSKFEVPKETITTDKFIYTENEKIDRRATLKSTMA